jgi:hypothetical protein
VLALLGALHAGTVIPFLVASLAAGTAQGATFAAGMRSLLAEAGPHDRAATLSAIYLLSYAGAAVPGFVAGQVSHSLGLFGIALGYGALAVIACAITLARAPRPHLATAPAARPRHSGDRAIDCPA